MSKPDKIRQLPYLFAKKHGVLVGMQENGTPCLYHLNNLSFTIFAEINRFIACELPLIEVNATQFQQHLAAIYQSQSSILEATEGMEEDFDLMGLAGDLPAGEDLLDTQDDAPIIRLINALFTQAIKQQASDIHIETYEHRVLIRNRIDGVLQEILELQRGIAPLVISRVKVMAKLDIAEKRIPQDGRISLQIGGHNIDVRVSTLPSNHGERIVLRILDQKAAQLNLRFLGMSSQTQQTIRQMIAEPHGVLLVTGPTGSGKTTSLYAMLTELNQVSRNILTIEDPIEYDLPGIGQTQANPKVQMTFANGLRAILRQDPDVVMIGEIRDLETAEIAIQASLTGHLVLSTLHTNSALGALTRLRDMGIEPFLLASSIVGMISQRLVRKLCPHCKQKRAATSLEQNLLDSSLGRVDNSSSAGRRESNCQHALSEIYEPIGCEECNNLGYKGRTGIYEIIPMDETLRGMVHRNESIQSLEQYIRPQVKTIRADGFRLVCQGETSIAEILRVTSLAL